MASTITDGPAIFAQVTLRSPMPAPAACFSISPVFSMAISGRKMAPNCWARAISLTSWALASDAGVPAMMVAAASSVDSTARRIQ
jgi:hypothetical protein